MFWEVVPTGRTPDHIWNWSESLSKPQPNAPSLPLFRNRDNLYGRLHGPCRQERGRTCPLCSAGAGVHACWHNVLGAQTGPYVIACRAFHTKCSKSSGMATEDWLHFVWECPACDHIRDRSRPVCANTPSFLNLCMPRGVLQCLGAGLC